ncbi:hypothetical protein ACSBR2_039613 [Camellia fascicularis]
MVASGSGGRWWWRAVASGGGRRRWWVVVAEDGGGWWWQKTMVEGGDGWWWQKTVVEKGGRDDALVELSRKEQYLSEVEHFAKNQTFEILNYWKMNATKFRVLSQLARDVLAMSISTIASKSAFTTEKGGRIFDPFRRSLSPFMVDALVCTQNWFRNNLPISLQKTMDDVQKFEQYDLGFIKHMHGTRIF